MQEEISFGVWLRKQRRGLDLSRQAFADQVGCAEVTLRRIEGGTLKPSKELASILLEKLGIPESERPQWVAFARGLSGFPIPSKSSPSKPITNLPAPLTTFIGREKEQADVIRLLAKHRLVTLTGSGGVGKTRLSIKVGEQILGNYPDGVRLVELAPILDPLLVPRTTAIAIGLLDEPRRPVIDMLADYLSEKQILIILDNCEHLLNACAPLAHTLLQCCPRLKILATSREALGILGEAVYSVPSLELPDFQQLLENFGGYEAVRLFEERAQLARMDFSLTIENASSVAKICSWLDGIPLAIELAAARVGSLSTEQIEERLQKSFTLLSTGNRTALPRHQTLQAAIDWSYGLLSPGEQTLFRRLSVFVNGWTLEAAESICSDANMRSETILDLLSQLIKKSLVMMEETLGRTSYRTLETIRQHANQKLIESGENDTLRDRHFKYFLTLAQTAEPHLMRPEQLEWLPVLDADYENLRLAFEWSLSKETADSSLNFCKALEWFWKIRFYSLEGLNWVKRALAKPFHNESLRETAARVRALATHAHLEWMLGNFEQMLSPAKASLALALEVSDRKDIAIAKFYLGAALRVKDKHRALSLMEESFAEFQALNEPLWQAFSFKILGEFRAIQGKLKYRDHAQRSLELAQKAGERSILADVLSSNAIWLLSINRLDEARECAEESDRLYKQIGSHAPSPNLFIPPIIAWVEGDTQKARSLFIEMLERYSIFGEKVFRALGTSQLGLLLMEEGDLDQARTYLEQAVVLSRETGFNTFTALYLIELSHLFYLQGNLEAFKQKASEGLSLRNYLPEAYKVVILVTILGSLYFQNPDTSARLLGILDHSDRRFDVLLGPLAKRFCGSAENHSRKVLGNPAFEVVFAEGQKMYLDEAIDLAQKTVEEMNV